MREWSDVIAICSLLIFVGKSTDWALRKQHKIYISSKLMAAEVKLKSFTFNQWEIVVANNAIFIYKQLHNGIILCSSIGPLAYTLLLLSIFPLIYLGNIVLFGLGMESYGIAAPIYIVLFMPYILMLLWTPKISKNNEGIGFGVAYVTNIALFSSIITAAALIIGSNIVGEFDLSYISSSKYFSSTAKPVALGILNLLFDIATITISFRLLRLISKNNKSYIYAFIDIMLSIVLSVVLLIVTLFVIGPVAFYDSISLTWNWLLSLLMMRYSSIPDGLMLITPAALTTAIPVMLYMGIIIFLAFIVRPALLLSSYMCGLLGEKDKSPFFEAATVLALFIGAIKAVKESQIF